MAKSKELSPMDADSTAQLEQAKKGKPRRFVLVCKGPQIVSLVLYKKGSIDKYKKQAKEAGSGQVYFGVVEGKGADVAFRLARADGFESEPTRAAVMKQFLAEHAEMNCKPAFEIVDFHLPLLDSDDPLHARFLRAQAAVPAAAAAHPDVAADLQALIGETGKLLDKDQREEVESKLTALEQLLRRLGGSPSNPASAPQPPAATREPPSPAAATTPAAGAAATPRAVPNRDASQAASIRPAPPPPPPAPPPKPAILPEIQRLTKAADGLGPRVIAAVKAYPQRRDEILRPVALFQKLLTTGKDVAAELALGDVLKVLASLEDTAEPAAQSSAASDSLVMLQKARHDWERARDAVENDLRTVEQSILDACREEPDFAEIRAGTKNLYTMLQTLDTRLGDKLDEALNADSPQLRGAKRREALAIAEDYLDFVIDDDLVNHIDDNGFAGVGVRLRLTTTLNDLVAQLA